MFVPARPDASTRTIAPSAPGLKLRDASVVTFHVAIGAFRKARRKPASLTLWNCRFLRVQERRRCCRRNREQQQKHRHFAGVWHRGPLRYCLQHGTNHHLASNPPNWPAKGPQGTDVRAFRSRSIAGKRRAV